MYGNIICPFNNLFQWFWQEKVFSSARFGFKKIIKTSLEILRDVSEIADKIFFFFHFKSIF